MSDNVTEQVDFDARYKIDRFGGVAFYLTGYAKKSVPVKGLVPTCANCGEFIEEDGENGWRHVDSTLAGCGLPFRDQEVYAELGPEIEFETGEFEEEDDPQFVIAIMVGDDREHIIDVEDLIKIDDLDYCSECGQIGCQHDGRDRS